MSEHFLWANLAKRLVDEIEQKEKQDAVDSQGRQPQDEESKKPEG